MCAMSTRPTIKLRFLCIKNLLASDNTNFLCFLFLAHCLHLNPCGDNFISGQATLNVVRPVDERNIVILWHFRCRWHRFKQTKVSAIRKFSINNRNTNCATVKVDTLHAKARLVLPRNILCIKSSRDLVEFFTLKHFFPFSLGQEHNNMIAFLCQVSP